jgi:hypothetical protein
LLRRAIALMMDATSTSETSVNYYQTTRRNNPEDSHLLTRRRENLKCHRDNVCFLEDRSPICKHYLDEHSPSKWKW